MSNTSNKTPNHVAAITRWLCTNKSAVEVKVNDEEEGIDVDYEWVHKDYTLCAEAPNGGYVTVNILVGDSWFSMSLPEYTDDEVVVEEFGNGVVDELIAALAVV